MTKCYYDSNLAIRFLTNHQCWYASKRCATQGDIIMLFWVLLGLVMLIAISIEKNKVRERKRHEELLASYVYEWDVGRETLTSGLDRNEAGQQERHNEIITEGKRDRELVKDIDRQVGRKEWWRH